MVQYILVSDIGILFADDVILLAFDVWFAL